jgi:hypothetical protein
MFILLPKVYELRSETFHQHSESVLDVFLVLEEFAFVHSLLFVQLANEFLELYQIALFFMVIAALCTDEGVGYRAMLADT